MFFPIVSLSNSVRSLLGDDSDSNSDFDVDIDIDPCALSPPASLHDAQAASAEHFFSGKPKNLLLFSSKVFVQCVAVTLYVIASQSTDSIEPDSRIKAETVVQPGEYLFSNTLAASSEQLFCR